MTPSTRRDRLSRDQQGFTLIEIMVVVVIIGLLATIVAPNIFGMGDQARREKAQADVTTIYDIVGMYKQLNHKLPTMEDLTTPDAKGETYFKGDNVSEDPWGHAYVIKEADRGKWEVISWGPDGVEGNEDDISSTRKKAQ